MIIISFATKPDISIYSRQFTRMVSSPARSKDDLKAMLANALGGIAREHAAVANMYLRTSKL